MTVLENLKLTNPDATVEQVETALEQAKAIEFLAE